MIKWEFNVFHYRSAMNKWSFHRKMLGMDLWKLFESSFRRNVILTFYYYPSKLEKRNGSRNGDSNFISFRPIKPDYALKLFFFCIC